MRNPAFGDIDIRRGSANRKCLDDVMRQYCRSHGGTDRTYTTEDMQSAISRMAGSDQSEFFKRYVFGTERVPIDQCLARAGFVASIEYGKLRVRGNPRADGLQRSIADKILGM